MKITIIGAYGCGNIGDDAILEGMIKKIEQQYGEGHEITVLALDTDYIESHYPVHAVRQVVARGLNWEVFRSFSFKQIFVALRSSDVVIIGGGSLIHDRRYYNMPYYVLLALWSKLFGAKVFLRGVSIGPLHTRLGKLLFKTLYWICSEVTYRDDRSRDWVERARIKGGPPSTDLAFMMYGEQEERIRQQRNYIAVNICGWFRSEEFWNKDQAVLGEEISAVAKLVDLLIEELDQDIVFVNTVIPLDSDISKRIVKEIVHADRVKVIDQIMTPAEVKQTIGQAQMLVGMRLHSIIFATLTNTPFVAINYDDKVKSFVQRIGQEPFLLEMDDLQEQNKVMETCKKCWQERENIIRTLRSSADNLYQLIHNETWGK